MADTSTHISWLMRLPAPVRASIVARQQRRADELLAPFVAHLHPTDRILDIGSGEGLLADALLRRGFDVSLADVVDKSMLPHLQPTVFDGITLPYPDDAFDVALLITVLHHIPDPEHTLREASRVARRVIVMEDVFQTESERRMTMLADSWVNWEWRGHPHSNRSDGEWRETFERLGLRVADAGEEVHTLWPWRFRHATYVLERRTSLPSFA